MADTVYLTATSESNASTGSVIYAATDERQAAGNGRAILIPDQTGKIDTWIIALKITSGSGKVQWTVDESLSEWFDWDSGIVSSDTSDTLFGVKAVRAVNVTGTVKLFVRVY